MNFFFQTAITVGSSLAISMASSLSAAQPNSTPTNAPLPKAETRVDFDALDRSLLAIISEKRSKEIDVQAAIEHLGRPKESPRFWVRIANDVTYSTGHRQKCVSAFFRRHGSSYSSLTDLALILDNPTWLRFDDVRRIDALTGSIPVDWGTGETVFMLPVLSNVYGVYLRLIGERIPVEAFVRALRRESEDLAHDFIILECGVFDAMAEEQLRGTWRKIQKASE